MGSQRAVSYGGAHKTVRLRGCFLGSFGGGFHSKFMENFNTHFGGAYHTHKGSSWEALRMLGVPAHNWDNEAWAGWQGLPEKKRARIIRSAIDMGCERRSNNDVMPGEKIHLRGNAMLSLDKPDLVMNGKSAAIQELSQHFSGPSQTVGEGQKVLGTEQLEKSTAGDESESKNGAVTNGVLRNDAVSISSEGAGAGTHRFGAEPEGGLAWLQELSISNFALVEEQIVMFSPGLNVITGESGSGKTILLQALGQILGASLAEDSIRPPATSATLEGRFVLAPMLRPILAFHLDGNPTAVIATLGDAGTSMLGGPVQLVLAREILGRGDENGPGKGGDDRRAGKARSVCKINGALVPLKVLRRVGAMLVDVNGQNSQATLRSEASQLEMLDRHAGASSYREQFAQLTERARAIWREMEELGKGGQREEKELTELVEEVGALGMDYGDEETWRNELKQQEAEQAAADHCRAVHSLMSEAGSSGRGVSPSGRGGAGIKGSLRAVVRELQSIVGESDDGEVVTWSGEASGSDVSDALDMVVEAQALLEAAEARVQEFASGLRFSESRALQLKQRLRQLQKLLRRYDVETADELLEKAEEAEERLNGKGDAEVRREALQAEWESLVPALCKTALELSLQRRRAAEGLRQAVEEALKQLAMERSRFHVDVAWVKGSASPANLDAADEDELDEDEFEEDDFEEEDDVFDESESEDEPPPILIDKGLLRVPDAGQVGEAASEYYHFTSSGVDRVTFKLAAGAGEPLLPLSNVASGGECARVMLALKTVPGAAEGGVPVAVFDELDSGVGGRIGARLGSSLRRLASAGHQVLCVTHLPQVAAYADQHVRVVKEPGQDGRSVTRAEVLDKEEARLEEIASMLGLGIPAARDLLAGVTSNGAPSSLALDDAPPARSANQAPK
ncbi:putative DNA recombination/repair protein [Klebsormidium nitens]|uniref:DNA repair protein RecN n=1 Tax=Klebsormidium nitens TaxID=105231 RepID=A0A1Y1HRM5_KLENI|nr:putative DNA recombination/repair protein [Klebsormidium nitens]|eukprot:GAQ81284.1 putative DNA recombination/repair protein [Klebsormidium nitens]